MGCLLLLVSVPLFISTVRVMPHVDEIGLGVNESTTNDKSLEKVLLCTTLPCAKSLLTMQPPFDDSQIIKLTDNLIKSPNTVVTGFFRISSKHSASEYDQWMPNMLSLQDAMVIFTERGMVDHIKALRDHAKNRTAIIPLEINQLPFANLYSEQFG